MTTPSHRLRLARVHGRFAVCRLSADAEIPAWASGGPFVSITRTTEELSIVCEEACLPPDATAERDFAAVRVVGTLEPTLVGVLVSLAEPLAAADIPILAIGTYDTDYVLVRRGDLSRATDALRAAGHDVADD